MNEIVNHSFGDHFSFNLAEIIIMSVIYNTDYKTQLLFATVTIAIDHDVNSKPSVYKTGHFFHTKNSRIARNWANKTDDQTLDYASVGHRTWFDQMIIVSVLFAD